jgi:hypothetical protein
MLRITGILLGIVAATGALAQTTHQHVPAEERTGTLPRAILTVDPAGGGSWTTLANGSPINPVHVALLHTGKVLIVSGSGNYPTNRVLTAGLWDPVTQLVTTVPIAWDMFCNGMAILPDGRVLIVGGTLQYDPFFGEPRAAVFTPATSRFTDVAPMADGRWYPTVTALPDGRMMAVSGLDKRGGFNLTTEIYDPGANTWTVVTPQAYPNLDLYPRQHLLPDGRVFESSFNDNTQAWSPVTKTWSFVARTRLEKPRVYGTSVLLPLVPPAYKPRVLILGGDTRPGITATTETIDLSAANPQWTPGPPMLAPRMDLNATLLPNGQVLVSGGSSVSEEAAAAVLQSELYDPDGNRLIRAAHMALPRLYHSNTILLADGRVLALGGNPFRGQYEGRIEIYEPPYLFNACGEPALRPRIRTIREAPGVVRYGTKFTIEMATVPEAIQTVVLVRPGSATHAFDMEQRLIRLSSVVVNGALSVTAPPDPRIAPPGYYLVFVLDANGVPSVGEFLRFGN